MALMRDKEKIQLKSEAFVFLLKLFLVPAKYNAILILLIKNIFHGWSYVQCRYLTDSKDVYFPAFLSLILTPRIRDSSCSCSCCSVTKKPG